MSDLQIRIDYFKDGKYNIGGNVKEAEVPELIDTFLRGQIGKGADNSKPNKRDKYTILIKVDLNYEKFTVKDNIGNKGLRDGILMNVSTRERERLETILEVVENG